MIKFVRVAAFAITAAIAGASANAALIYGELTFDGNYTSNGSGNLALGDTIYFANPATVTQDTITGGPVGSVDLDMFNFKLLISNTFSANGGERFTDGQQPPLGYLFDTTATRFSFVQGTPPPGKTQVHGNMNISAPNFQSTKAAFSLEIIGTATSGAYRFHLESTGVPSGGPGPVPLPAALPLLAAGTGLLTLMARRRRKS